ncbi:MAG TPA: DNA-processing protein DprA [Acidimicrobiales bacterium]|nr:DNA-processing protein DprA [Acidimicrobiales bacterium]
MTAGGAGAGAGPRAVGGALPDRAWWVALAGLPGMGPARLRALREALAPEEAWRVVASGRAHLVPAVAAASGGRAGEVAARWARAAADLDVGERWRAHAHLGVSLLGEPGHPARVADDPEPPVVLFSDGDRGALAGPTVAVVGTRRCTRAGAELAVELGLACARAGVRVVSGLAVGIDAAAHRGALAAGEGAAPPVAVVGTGLDVVYPARSRSLWEAVAASGVVLSEHPLGTGPARWRFPARNRLVAALADAVVVVESPRTGGSMYTVDEALRRDRPVLAVPGPVRSAASSGTNWLLSQGAAVATGPEDVLAALGVAPEPTAGGPVLDPRPPPTGDGRRVLRALGWAPAGLDTLARRTGLGLGPLAVALDRLESDGWVHRDAGQIERRGRP